ncbi:MAG: hypothetical protein JKY65_25695 [Planctomycetes bacterium]|nr:hypothetical protein [Planctomycetota bacterium]
MLTPKDIGAAVEKLNFGHSLKSPVAAVTRTRYVTIQSLTTAKSYAAGSKGTLKVGLFLSKGITLGEASITIRGPKGFKAEVKTLPGITKAKVIVEVPFEVTKDAAKGAQTLTVEIVYTPKKKGKDKGLLKLSYTLPIQIN